MNPIPKPIIIPVTTPILPSTNITLFSILGGVGLVIIIGIILFLVLRPKGSSNSDDE